MLYLVCSSHELPLSATFTDRILWGTSGDDKDVSLLWFKDTNTKLAQRACAVLTSPRESLGFSHVQFRL